MKKTADVTKFEKVIGQFVSLNDVPTSLSKIPKYSTIQVQKQRKTWPLVGLCNYHFFEFGRLSVGYLKTRSVIGYRSVIYKQM